MEQQLAVRSSRGGAMALYATGFNAWNQLAFDEPTKDEPDDIYSFAKITDSRRIDRVQPRLSYTIVHRDGVPCVAGASGDLVGLADRVHAISGTGTILTTKAGEENVPHVVSYSSIGAWKSDFDGNPSPAKSWSCKSPAKQIAAYETGFVILHEDSSVTTLGDARFEDCLGRDVDDSRPADEPGLVSDLGDLGESITKVTAGGYNLAALTEGGAVYIWGANSTGSHSRHQPFPEISGIPSYMEVDGDKDVLDIALGESHGIALTIDGSVYVIGDNTNGQLGLGRDFSGVAQSWTKVSLDLELGWGVVGVEAGPRSSFILTAKRQPK